MSNQWSGSLQNRIHERAVIGQPDPVVGMGATILHYTDRSAVTITQVQKMKNGRFLIEVQRDIAKRVDQNGMSECQKYEYTRNPDGAFYWYRQNKAGIWEAVRENPQTGKWNKVNGGAGLRIGDRAEYYDFSF